MADTPLSVRLWKENADLVEVCLRHPFVRGLADGSLPKEAFARYVAQDVFYLEGFFRGYALAAARSDGRHDLAVTMYRLMGGVLDELAMHADHAADLGIDTSSVVPYRSTEAYLNLLLDRGWHGELGEVLVVMTPCMRLYAFLGQSMAPRRTEDHPFRGWIDAYAGAQMESLAAELEGLVDEFADDSPAIHELYRCAMEHELAFFSAAYSGPT